MAVTTCAAVSFPILAARSPQTRAIVIDAAHIIDGTGTAPLDHGRIVIEGDHITRIGRADDVAKPAGAEAIDVPDGTVLPGLIFTFTSKAIPGWRCGS
jgi:adenine deaminase